MIRINLLPFRAARKKENIRQTVSIFLMLLILVLIGLGWYHVVLSREIDRLKERIAYTKSEVTKFNKIAAEVEEIKKKLAVLNKRLDVIIQLEANRDSAFKILDTLANSIIEKRMWLTSFETIEPKAVAKAAPKKTAAKDDKKTEEKKEKPPVTAKIEGIALDEKTISDFMEKLKSGKVFTDVDQQIKVEQKGFKQDKTKPDVYLKGFTMRCTIAPPMPVQKETDKDKKDKDKKDADKADKDKADKSKADKKG
jgi:type IV pilus assembly protein PilN